MRIIINKTYLERAFLLSLFFINTFFASAQYSGSGTGTKDDPYLIMNADQLYSIRNFLNNSSVYFSIICNIDLSDYSYGSGWEPIGTASSPFKGTIYGNGCVISGLEIQKSTKDCVGLFGCTYAAIIKNITVEGHVTGNNYVGGIVGKTLSSNYSTEYEDVHFKGVINGNNYVGGIAGFDSPNDGYTSTGPGIEYNKCGFSGTISGKDNVGGILGYSYSKITNSSVDAIITANEYVGGISGDMRGLIENCYVSLNLSASSGFVGGISGNGTGGDIKKCSVNGRIVALGNNVGGIIGYAHCFSGVRHDFYISDSYYNGFIKANDYVGGIVGYNAGAVWHDKLNYKYWGYVCVQNNYVKASIVGHDKVGGILSGFTFSNNPLITSNVCMCTSIDSETENVGRIQANKNGSTPKNCYSLYSTKVRVGGVNVSEEDIESYTTLHGTDIGENNLKKATFYQGLSWDFGSTWAILDTECLPYLQTQAAPPIIQYSSANDNSSIYGKSLDGGYVTVNVEGNKYIGTTANNNWSVIVPELSSGAKIIANATVEGLFPSYNTEEYVPYEGKGTQESPYLIRTYSEFKNIHGEGYYKLENDIDLNDNLKKNSPFEGWQPLGVYSESIKYFDGDNHKISNLFISRDEDCIGLFSSLTDATIKNLIIETMVDKGINGKDKVGVLAGRLNNCTIDNVSIKGIVNGNCSVGGLAGQVNDGTLNNVIVSNSTITGKNYVGGIVGTNSSSIRLCRFKGKVTDVVEDNDGIDENTTVFVGGVAATSKGTICETMSEGYVTATRKGSKSGGLVGDNNSIISNSYCTATVIGDTYAAGIAAINSSSVQCCYASGNITTTNQSAQTVSCGLIGYNEGEDAIVANNTVMNKYIVSSSDVGNVYRIIGGIKNNASIPSCTNYAINEMVLSVNGIRRSINDDPFNGYMKDETLFTTKSFYIDNGWNFTTAWSIDEGLAYPIIKHLKEYPASLGDANNDGKINIGDFTAIASYIMGTPPKNFVEKAADVNLDKKINVGDLTAVATIILYGTLNPISNIKAMKRVATQHSIMQVADRSVVAGEEFTIDVNITDNYAFSAYQFDIVLPKGISVKKVNDTPQAWPSTEGTNAKATDFFTAGMTKEGNIRILAASTKGTRFVGTEAAVAHITLIADKDIKTGDHCVELKNIVLADRGDCLTLSNCSFVTTVSETMGLSSVENESRNDVYNLQGMKINDFSTKRSGNKGIYIINGKKVVR